MIDHFWTGLDTEFLNCVLMPPQHKNDYVSYGPFLKSEWRCWDWLGSTMQRTRMSEPAGMLFLCDKMQFPKLILFWKSSLFTAFLWKIKKIQEIVKNYLICSTIGFWPQASPKSLKSYSVILRVKIISLLDFVLF